MPTDLEVMADISATLEQERGNGGADAWANSDFRWLRSIAPASRGAVGKKMFRRWASNQGLTVGNRPIGQPADCIVEGLEIVVKFGLLWQDGNFTFEQIRQQPYDAGALLALEPHAVHLWIVPGKELWNISTEQHGRDTHWLSFRPANVPAALHRYGGGLATARAALLEQARDKATGG